MCHCSCTDACNFTVIGIADSRISVNTAAPLRIAITAALRIHATLLASILQIHGSLSILLLLCGSLSLQLYESMQLYWHRYCRFTDLCQYSWSFTDRYHCSYTDADAETASIATPTVFVLATGSLRCCWSRLHFSFTAAGQRSWPTLPTGPMMWQRDWKKNVEYVQLNAITSTRKTPSLRYGSSWQLSTARPAENEVQAAAATAEPTRWKDAWVRPADVGSVDSW